MTRGSFFKSLLGLAVSPKILAEIDFSKVQATNIAANVSVSGNLFSDLNLLTPYYYQRMLEKYGNENYTTLMEELSK